MVELEDLQIALLDDNGGTWDRGQLGELELQLARGQRGDEIGQGFALHRRLQLPVDDESGVARTERLASGCRLPVCEGERIALADIDSDLQAGDSASAGAGKCHRRTCLLGGAGGLPEDHLPAAGVGDDDLGAVLPPAVENEVDRGAPPHTGPHRHPLDDLGVARPLLDAVAVDLAGARPRVLRLEG